MKELLNQGTKITFEHGTLSGNGEICGTHLQYVGNMEEPFIFYIVEAYDFPNDNYEYSHLLVEEKEIKIIE